MKTTFSVIILLLFAQTAVATCIDLGGGNPNAAGMVRVQYLPANCEAKGPNRSYCVRMEEFDRDYCIDSQTVLKYYCDDDLAKSMKAKCQSGQTCQAGACRQSSSPQ